MSEVPKPSYKTSDIAAGMFYSCMAVHKESVSHVSSRPFSWYRYLRELSHVLSADVSFIVSFRTDAKGNAKSVRVPEDCRYVTPTSRETTSLVRLNRTGWEISLEDPLFSEADEQPYKILEKHEDEMGCLANGLNTALRGQLGIGESRVFFIVAWSRTPEYISTIYQFGPTLLEVWCNYALQGLFGADEIPIGYQDLAQEIKIAREALRTTKMPLTSISFAP